MRVLVVSLSLFGFSLVAVAESHGTVPTPGRAQAPATDGKKKATIERVEIAGKFKGGATLLEKFNIFQATMSDSTVSPKLTDNIDLTKAKRIEFIRPKAENLKLGTQDFLSSGNGRNLLIQLGGEAEDENVRRFLRGAVEELEVRFTDVPLLNGGTVGTVTLRLRR